MDDLTAEGEWWVPGHEELSVPGTLTIAGNHIELTLRSALRDEPPDDSAARRSSQPWRDEPILHGTDWGGKAYTLFNVSGPNGRPPNLVYSTGWVLDDCHTAADLFTEMTYTPDWLDLWADGPHMTDESASWDEVHIRMVDSELASASVDGAEVRVVCRPSGRVGGRRVDLRRATHFRVVSAEPIPASDFFLHYLKPLHDFLALCIDRPIQTIDLGLRPEDQKDQRDGCAAVQVHLLEHEDAERATYGLLENFTSPTVLTGKNAPASLDVLLDRWFANWSSLSAVCAPLMAPLSIETIYGEHRFTSAFMSAEAMHAATEGSNELSKAEHNARVEDVETALRAANVEDPTIEWAIRVLRDKNYKRLGTQLDELLDATGAVGAAIREADPKFTRNATKLRSTVSHGGASRSSPVEQRYWYGEILRWTVRARILMLLLDDPADAQSRIATRDPFVQCLDKIRRQ